GGRDPAAIVDAGADRALNVGQRRVDDLDVEHRKERTQRRTDDGEPGLEGDVVGSVLVGGRLGGCTVHQRRGSPAPPRAGLAFAFEEFCCRHDTCPISGSHCGVPLPTLPKTGRAALFLPLPSSGGGWWG